MLAEPQADRLHNSQGDGSGSPGLREMQIEQ